MEIVVIGAGYGGITAALRLARLLRHRRDCRVHLIDQNPYHTLKTQLVEAAVRQTAVAIPIADIIKGRPILFHPVQVTVIDLARRLVVMGEETLPFDYLVFALGSHANFYNIPELAEHSFPLQTVVDAERIYGHIRELCAAAGLEANRELRQGTLRFVIGGGGLSGVEFAAEMADHAALCVKGQKGVDPTEVEVLIIEGGDTILPTMDEALRKRSEERLLAKGVKIMTHALITSLTPEAVTLATGEEIRTRTLIWTGGIRVSALAGESGLTVGPMGRIVVDEFLRAHGHPQVYAIGDSALAVNPETGRTVPAAAQFALQQGRVVAENIQAAITAGPLKPYRPRVLGEIVSLGRHLAVGWMALPLVKKITFFGFVASLLKAASAEKHILLLRKESRNWIRY